MLSPPDQRTPAGPRAVAFRASLPDNALGAMGSPLFNTQGRVVAVYTEPAPKKKKIENFTTRRRSTPQWFRARAALGFPL